MLWLDGVHRRYVEEVGPLTQKLYDTIVGIQYGTTPDARGWTVEV